MTEKVLLTGVGGSIGCHTLIHILHNTDWDVIGIDSFRHKGLADRVTKVLVEHPEYNNRVRIVKHDLNLPIDVKEVGSVDYVIAMASLSDVHDSIINPVPFFLNNINIVVHTTEYARAVNPKSFMLISTDEVYGPTDGKTFHKEWAPIVPSNSYSASKVAQEAWCISQWRSYNLPLVIVNLMNNFGEMQSPYKFPSIIQRKVRADEVVQIHTNGKHIGSRAYLHSRNASDAMLFILKHVEVKMHEDGGTSKPERFNIVGEKQIDNLELAKLIAEMIGKPLRFTFSPSAASRPGHDIHYGLDGSKLRDLGWKPPLSFEESMRNTVQWYEQNPEWLRADLCG